MLEFSYWYILLVILLTPVFIKLCRIYFSGGVCNINKRLDNKNVIITGGTKGIGKETALELAKRGARIILACKDIKKANLVADEIKFKSKSKKIFVRYLDLSSIQSVIEFSKKINEQEESVDILINNAGILCPKSKTIDGFDMLFCVNFLGHFILTNAIMGKLLSAPSGRIINLSSVAYESGRIKWSDIMMNEHYISLEAYSQSKLAMILFTREFARRYKGTSVRICSVNPGIVNTNFTRHLIEKHEFPLKFIDFLITPLKLLFMKTPLEGAQTTIYCAVVGEIKNGGYYSDCKEKTLLKHALNTVDGYRLWRICEKLDFI